MTSKSRGFSYLGAPNILIHQYSARLLEAVEDKRERRGGVALGEEFLDQEEIVGATVLERGWGHGFWFFFLQLPGGGVRVW